jgi:hypothetical protein
MIASSATSTLAQPLIKRVVLTYTPNNYLEWENCIILHLNRSFGLGNIIRAGAIPAELEASIDLPQKTRHSD